MYLSSVIQNLLIKNIMKTLSGKKRTQVKKKVPKKVGNKTNKVDEEAKT